MTVYGQLNVRNIIKVGDFKIIKNNINTNIIISIKSINIKSNIVQVDDSKMMISLEVSLRYPMQFLGGRTFNQLPGLTGRTCDWAPTTKDPLFPLTLLLFLDSLASATPRMRC